MRPIRSARVNEVDELVGRSPYSARAGRRPAASRATAAPPATRGNPQAAARTRTGRPGSVPPCRHSPGRRPAVDRGETGRVERGPHGVGRRRIHAELQVEHVRGGQPGHGGRADVGDTRTPCRPRAATRAASRAPSARPPRVRGRPDPRTAPAPGGGARRLASNGTSRPSHSASTAARERRGRAAVVEPRRRRRRGGRRRRPGRRSGPGRPPPPCPARSTSRRTRTSASACTTTTSANAAGEPVSTSSGTSCTTIASPVRRRPAPRCARRTRGCTIPLSRRAGLGVAEHDRGQRGPVRLPSGRARRSRTVGDDRAEPGGAGRDDLAGQHVRVDEHRTALREPARDRRLAGSDAPGEPHPQHRRHPTGRASPVPPGCPRRAGLRGRPGGRRRGRSVGAGAGAATAGRAVPQGQVDERAPAGAEVADPDRLGQHEASACSAPFATRSTASVGRSTSTPVALPSATSRCAPSSTAVLSRHCCVAASTSV